MPLSTTLIAWSQNHRLLTKWDRAETLLRCFAGLVLAVGVSSSSLRSPLMPEVPLSRWCIRVQLQCHPVAFYHTTPIKKNRESECWTFQMIADNWANEQDTPQVKLWFHTWAHSHSRWGRVVQGTHWSCYFLKNIALWEHECLLWGPEPSRNLLKQKQQSRSEEKAKQRSHCDLTAIDSWVRKAR